MSVAWKNIIISQCKSILFIVLKKKKPCPFSVYLIPNPWPKQIFHPILPYHSIYPVSPSTGNLISIKVINWRARRLMVITGTLFIILWSACMYSYMVSCIQNIWKICMLVFCNKLLIMDIFLFKLHVLNHMRFWDLIDFRHPGQWAVWWHVS